MAKLYCVLLLLLWALSANADADFYQLLGINVDASESDIRRAFRRESVKHHPDKNPGNEQAAETFRRLNRAYEVLTDGDKRHVYDNYGEDILERYERGERQLQRGPSSKLEVPVTLEELYSGGERFLTISRDVICDKCKGTGAKDGKVKQCPTCSGQGVVLEQINVGHMRMQMQKTCPKCRGQGVISAHKCEKCKGKKVHPETKTLHVKIEPGMQNEEKIVFEKDAQQQPGVIPGDVIVILKQQKHNNYSRVGNNLFTEMKITLQEALLGFKKPLRLLDGRTIEVRSEPNEIIQPFSWKIIEGEGMPIKENKSQKGQLHVKFIVSIPSQLSAEQKEVVKKIFKEETE